MNGQVMSMVLDDPAFANASFILICTWKATMDPYARSEKICCILLPAGAMDYFKK